MSGIAKLLVTLGVYAIGVPIGYRYLQERLINKLEFEHISSSNLDPCDRADIRIRVREESNQFIIPALLWPILIPMAIADEIVSY